MFQECNGRGKGNKVKFTLLFLTTVFIAGIMVTHPLHRSFICHIRIYLLYKVPLMYICDIFA